MVSKSPNWDGPPSNDFFRRSCASRSGGSSRQSPSRSGQHLMVVSTCFNMAHLKTWLKNDKKIGVHTKSSHFNRVWNHYKVYPFWGNIIFGNTQMVASQLITVYWLGCFNPASHFQVACQ